MSSATEIRALGWRKRFLAVLLACLLKCWLLTLRWRFEDGCGFMRKGKLTKPLIWCFWHNQILVLPGAYRRSAPWRRGSVLTSASHDGAFLAAVINQFGGVNAVRGSSSRRGKAALRELMAVIEAGGDVAITPDGPRGPRYRLAPGVIRLAQQTGAEIVPIRVEFARAKMLKTWDALRLPIPFSTVKVFFDPLLTVPAELSEEEFERYRLSLQEQLMPSEEVLESEPQRKRKS